MVQMQQLQQQAPLGHLHHSMMQALQMQNETGELCRNLKS